jgi:hypothetical protein
MNYCASNKLERTNFTSNLHPWEPGEVKLSKIRLGVKHLATNKKSWMLLDTFVQQWLDMEVKQTVNFVNFSQTMAE